MEIERKEFFDKQKGCSDDLAPIPINCSDIDHMEQTMQGMGLAARSIDPVWKRAFDEYNASNKPNLHLNCSPCYMKVYLFHKNRLKNLSSC